MVNLRIVFSKLVKKKCKIIKHELILFTFTSIDANLTFTTHVVFNNL